MFIGSLIRGERGRLGQVDWLPDGVTGESQERLGAIYLTMNADQRIVGLRNTLKSGMTENLRSRMSGANTNNPQPLRKFWEVQVSADHLRAHERALKSAFAHKATNGETEKFNLSYFELNDLMMINCERMLIRFIQAASSTQGRLLYNTLENALVRGMRNTGTEERAIVLASATE